MAGLLNADHECVSATDVSAMDEDDGTTLEIWEKTDGQKIIITIMENAFFIVIKGLVLCL
jgi:hypothetical protein